MTRLLDTTLFYAKGLRDGLSALPGVSSRILPVMKTIVVAHNYKRQVSYMFSDNETIVITQVDEKTELKKRECDLGDTEAIAGAARWLLVEKP